MTSMRGDIVNRVKRLPNLPAEYPVVAPGYAAARSQLAKEMGLGRKKNTRKRAA